MYAAARWSRGGTKENALGRSGIRYPPCCWAREQLPYVHDATAHIATLIVRVVPLEIRRRQPAPCQDAFAEPRGKPLHLLLDCLRHLHSGAAGHMTVGPAGVLSLWCPRRVEQALLGNENIRPFG